MLYILMVVLLVLQTIATSAAPASTGDANRPLSVLLVGNSHLLMPGFTKRLMRNLKGADKPHRTVKLGVIAKIGTTLTKSRKQKNTRRQLMATAWDVIVLQESTTAFMTKHGRHNFQRAVDWFQKHKPAKSKLLLWQAWPQGARHALYARRGVWGRWFKNPPRNPNQLFSWIASGVHRAANKHDLAVSPIGYCWMRLARRKRPYAGDAYHPNGRGLTFIARILASSIVATADGRTGNETRIVGECP